MAAFDVDKARYLQVQAAKARARAEQGFLQKTATKFRRAAYITAATLALGAAAPKQAQPETIEDEQAELEAGQELQAQQAQARAQMVQQQGVAQAEQAQTTAAKQETKDASDKQKKHRKNLEAKGKLQRLREYGEAIAVVPTLAGGGVGGIFDMLQLAAKKTVSLIVTRMWPEGKEFPVWEKWGIRTLLTTEEKFEAVIQILTIVILGTVVVLFLAILGYMYVYPVEAFCLLPAEITGTIGKFRGVICTVKKVVS